MNHEVNSSYDSELKYGQWANRKSSKGGIFTPTQALAGSEEKQAVLEYRAAHGLPLFHPGDCTDVQGSDRREGKIGPDTRSSKLRATVNRPRSVPCRIAVVEDRSLMDALGRMSIGDEHPPREWKLRWDEDRL